MFERWLFAALAAQAALPAAAPSVASQRAPSPAWEAASANRARVKQAPSFKIEPDAVRPEEARQRGEFGEVILIGIIGADGHVTEARVKSSSRSAIIDAAALASVPAMVFEPARDAAGQPLAIVSNMSLEYPHVGFHGKAGLRHYRCDQFVRDYDWWYRTWPADKVDRVFATVRGFVTMAYLQRRAPVPDFGAEWKAAVEACRGQPDRLMIDMLTPDGRIIRDMIRP